jgi:hypothetical protein
MVADEKRGKAVLACGPNLFRKLGNPLFHGIAFRELTVEEYTYFHDCSLFTAPIPAASRT